MREDEHEHGYRMILPDDRPVVGDEEVDGPGSPDSSVSPSTTTMISVRHAEAIAQYILLIVMHIPP